MSALFDDDGDPSAEIDDEEVCACCLDGDVFDGNEILFCDKCNVAVHQSCYGVPKIPKHSWFCNVCKAGGNPMNTKCELCWETGGAYKPSDVTGKWVHSLCANWMPEIYCGNAATMQPYIISGLDKKRFNLKCNLCKNSGACIQCSFGKCTVSAHPRCALEKISGFTHRIIKDPDSDSSLWQIFCKSHAEAVKDPLKPSKKGRRTVDSDEDETPTATQKRGRKSKVDSESDSDSIDSDSDSVDSECVAIRKRGSTPVPTSQSTRNSAPRSSSSAALTNAVFDEEFWNRQYAERELGIVIGEEEPGKQDDKSSTLFKVCTMSEWPGQSVGEAMDLHHFWQVILMHFPEDHPHEWAQFMSSIVDISDNDPVFDVPELGTMTADLKRKADEILSSYSDRERQHIFDTDHRDNYLASLLYYTEKLKGHVNSAEFLSQIPEPTDTSMEDITPTPEPENANTGDAEAQEKKKGQGGRKPPRRSNSGLFSNSADSSLIEGNHHVVSESGQDEVVETFTFCHDKNPDNVLYSEGKSYLVKEIIDGTDETTTDSAFKINVLFDGKQRTSCTFRIDAEDSADNKGSTYIPADADGKWADLHLIGPHRDPKISTNKPPFNSKICLECSESYPEDKDVYLPDRTLISRAEDDAVFRVLRTDQELYRRFMSSAKERVSNLLTSGIEEIVLKKAQERRRWIETENIYLKQRIWKKVGTSVCLGMRDRAPDASAEMPSESSIIPASWLLQVPGRPPKPVDDDPDEQLEDSVCMCCFDGASHEGNPILFCDGCNATVHQACYGVKEIPEGDFYCDRCQAIQWFSTECDDWCFYFTKNAVRCALCPLHHGGLKPTTDGRWVHICCAMWADNSVIKSLDDMSPIDIAEVSLQPSVSNGESEVSDPKSCLYCNSSAGRIVRCCGGENDLCSKYFHPLCAWFKGVYCKTINTDPSYQGIERNGKYPSGLHFSFYCEVHCPVEFASPQNREFQAQLRSKYRIDETDLEYIPGKNRNKRRKKKQKKEKPPSSSRIGSHLPDFKKDLRDNYDENICAICLSLTKNPGDIDSCFPESGIIETKTCITCNITIHSHCENGIIRPAPLTDDGQWKCIPCSSLDWKDEPISDPNCAICPRRGGYFRSTYDARWVHSFCAKFAPGVCTFTDEGDVHVKKIDKSLKNKACSICNRTRGLCVRCVIPGCHVMFHSMCAEKSRISYQKIRNGVKYVFCSEHIPENARKLPESGWLDQIEMQWFHFSLEKARSIADSCRRRDKMKKLICSTEGELFVSRFNRLLEKSRLLKSSSSMIEVGQIISGPGVFSGTKITAMGTGTGAEGTYELFIPNDIQGTNATGTEMELSKDDVEDKITGDVQSNSLDVELNVDEGLDQKQVVSNAAVTELEITDDDVEDKITGGAQSNSLDVELNVDEGLDQEQVVSNAAVTEMEITDDDVEDKITVDVQSNALDVELNVDEGLATPNPDNTSYVKEEKTHGPLISENSTELNTSIFILPEVEKSSIFVATGEAIAITFKGYIDGNILTVVEVVSQSLVSDADDILNSSVFRDTDLEEEFKTIIDLSTAATVKKKKTKDTPEKKKSGGISDWQSFEGQPIGEEVEWSSKRGQIKISSTWLNSTRNKVKVPENRFVYVAGLDLVKSDFLAYDDENEYLSAVQSRMQKVAADTRASANVFKSDKDAEKFPKLLGNDIKTILSLSMPDFKKEKSRVETILNAYKKSLKAQTQIVKTESPAKKKSKTDEEIVDPQSTSLSFGVMHTLEEQVDVLFSSLVPFVADPKASFDATMASSGLLVSEGEDEWAVPSSEEGVLCLERRVQDILNIVETFEVDKTFILPEENILEYRMSVYSSSSKGKNKFVLSDAFQEVPYSLIPDYDKQVKRPLSLQIISKKLKRHEYSSMHMLSKDFYEMLTNGRKFAPEKGDLWRDTEDLARLFERSKMDSLSLPASVVISSSGFKLNATETSEKGNRGTRLRCAHCLARYDVPTWPKGAYYPPKALSKMSAPTFENITAEDYMLAQSDSWGKILEVNEHHASIVSRIKSSTKDPLSWLCHRCVDGEVLNLIGRTVKVWWHEDKAYYSGVIDACDRSSRRYRVQYFDGDWEFVDLRAEPVLISYLPAGNYSDLVKIDVESPVVSISEPSRRGSSSSSSKTPIKETPKPDEAQVEPFSDVMYKGKAISAYTQKELRVIRRELNLSCTDRKDELMAQLASYLETNPEVDESTAKSTRSKSSKSSEGFIPETKKKTSSELTQTTLPSLLARVTEMRSRNNK